MEGGSNDPIAQYLSLCRDPYGVRTEVVERPASKVVSKKLAEAVQVRQRHEKRLDGRLLSQRRQDAIQKHLNKRYQAFLEDDAIVSGSRFNSSSARESTKADSPSKRCRKDVEGIFQPFQIKTAAVDAELQQLNPEKPSIGSSSRKPAFVRKGRSVYTIQQRSNQPLVKFLETIDDVPIESIVGKKQTAASRLEAKLGKAKTARAHFSKTGIQKTRETTPRMSDKYVADYKKIIASVSHRARNKIDSSILPKVVAATETERVTAKVDDMLAGIVRWRSKVLQFDVPSVFVADNTWEKSVAPSLEALRQSTTTEIQSPLQHESTDPVEGSFAAAVNEADFNSDSSWTSELSYDMMDLLSHR